MRLLQRDAAGEIVLTDFANDKIPPPYAILSHTWESEEVIFEDIKNGTAKPKLGYVKILFCAEQAQRDGLQYFWVDTCCIDKTSSAEVQESINRMFRWYRDAARCYVYLSDVSTTKRRKQDSSSSQSAANSWETDFRNSRWFTRGWTLQELLAPVSVEFYSREEELLGDKKSLEQQIYNVTRIPTDALRGHPMSSYSKAQRLGWVETRNTTREEDKAYCMFGVFDVQIPLLYGEGEARAFRRLHEEIDKGSQDDQETYSRCMADLRSTDPRNDKARIQQAKGGLLSDSYAWITEKDEFLEWRASQGNQLLWIRGDPGKGKTMLMCGIIDELSPSTRLQDETSSTLLSYFFCQATDAQINNATSLLRGLIYMLVDQRPSLISHVRKRYDLAGKQLFEDRNAWVALSEIFSSILNDPNLDMAYIIIDALDECTTGLDLLLDFIIDKSEAHPRAKWIVSSRNWPMIHDRLSMAAGNVALHLELNKDAISSAVGAYIQHKIESLAKVKRYDNKTKQTVSEYLLSNARDTFLWVALVCHELARPEVRRYNTLSTLRKFPPELSKLYRQMLDQICSMDDSEVFKKILAVTSAVYRPITLHELASLVTLLEDFSDNQEYLAEFIELCGSFLTIRDGTVFFVHQSAKDFLLDEAKLEISPEGIQEVHYELFDQSLKIISNTLKRDIYDLVSPGFPIYQVTTPRPDPLADARYSCIYWVDHLAAFWTPDNTDRNSEGAAAVANFLETDYLHWLEALSLLRSMSLGVASMLKLSSLMQDAETAENVSEAIEDACRFIQYHKWTIENSPLQTYSSALIFSPAASSIRESYTSEEPQWIPCIPIMENDWSACFSTLEGHNGPVNSVSWSPTAALVVSGSKDGTAKIWDPSVNQCILTLEGHSKAVSSVAWSPDSKHVASASEDKTVRIWDAKSGRCASTLHGHTDAVRFVSWAPKTQRLASASSDKTIRVWNAETAQSLSVLEGHDKPVTSLAWSSEVRLASASEDGIIKIWDIPTGKCQATLEGHTDSVNSVAWSPTDGLLASTSSDKTVKIWNTSTFQCIMTLEGHTDCVRSITWFADGVRLITSSDDNMVKLWSTKLGQCTATLKGHGDSVLSISFSETKKWLASASTDTTVKIWDSSIEMTRADLGDHSNWVTWLAWSRDGLNLASAADDCTLKIWDLTNGRCKSTLTGHSDWVNTVAWSGDATKLASGSDDKTIKIWDPNTSECVLTLAGHENWIQSVAWSSDITRLASSSSDATIRIWNPLTGECVRTITEHGDAVISVVWSQDAKRLASASDDKTVKIWDAATGQCISTFEDFAGVTKVAWLSSHSRVVSVSRVGMSKLWEIETGQLLKTVEGYNFYLAWSFDMTKLLPESDDTIMASKTASLSLADEGDLVSQHIGVNGDGTWITYKGKNLVALPSDYRPCAAAVHGNCLALGCASGRVLLFMFSDLDTVV